MPIRVATLNAWALPAPIARDVSARIDAIGQRLESLEVDIVAFQEVWTAEARSSLVRAGRAAGLLHVWDGDGDSRLGTARGGLHQESCNRMYQIAASAPMVTI